MPDTYSWEEERQRQLADILEEPDAAENFAPGTLGLHELLDRAHLASVFFQDHVLAHPACVLSEDLWRQAAAIADSLAQFYQKVGEASATDE